MENHAARTEVADALRYGAGESERYSATLSQKTFYYACRLQDGTVLRLAGTRDSVLGILLTGTFHGARNFTLAKPMLFAVLTAMTDETIQAFTPGRNCALSDVWLDAAGALTGAVLLWLIFKLRKK